jgi:phosphoribosyl 1,2-cyclic phosphodiesterase
LKIALDLVQLFHRLAAYSWGMMRMTVLASGSKGNSMVISSARTRILVDAGMSCREIFKRMRAADENPATLDAILVTHEHQDHVQGVAVTARKLGVPVFFTEATHRAWMRWMKPQKRMTYAEWLAQRKQAAEEAEGPCVETREQAFAWEGAEAVEGEEDKVEAGPEIDSCRLPCVEYFQAGSRFCVGDITVTPFTIPHDAADPVGFVFEADGVRMGLATDLGYIPSNVQQQLRNCDVLMIESNHDLEMLRDGPYPWSVKQRVMSRVGHLSNEAASDFLERNYDGKATYVVLAHLSESNNLPELARVSAERALRERISLLTNKLVLARQEAPMESICL